MSAEVLREAARLMRNRAMGADGGRWQWAEQTHGEWYGIQSEHEALGRVYLPGNAFHVASWHPDVALAVADWLDATAETFSAARFRAYDDALVSAALSVARAYLGAEVPA